MAYRTVISIAAATVIGIASVSTEAMAFRGGFHGGGFRAGGFHAGGARMGGVYRGGAYRGGVYRGAYARRGWGVGAGAVGAAAVGAAAAPELALAGKRFMRSGDAARALLWAAGFSLTLELGDIDVDGARFGYRFDGTREGFVVQQILIALPARGRA